MLSLTGCGKNDMVSWIKTTEPLQEWYETTSSVASENITLMKSVDAFVKCHEEGVDYGLAYGITTVLCEKLELCDGITSISNEELAEYFANQENLYLLDFTLPMFETYYFDEDTAKYVQAAAVSFVKMMDEQGRLEDAYRLCVAADSEKIAALKNNWLESIGVEETYEPYAVLNFEYNHAKEAETYPYVLSDSVANWYFHPDDVNEYGYKAFVEEYLVVKELMILDFADARQLFSNYLPENVPVVDIRTAFLEEGAEGGVYFPLNNYIELYYDWETAQSALLHEYVHYLTMGVVEMVQTGGAFAEGIAEEAAVWGCENRLLALVLSNMAEEERAKGTAYWDEEKNRVTAERKSHINAQAFFLGGQEGKQYFTVSQYVTVRPEKIEKIGLLSYEEMASLTHYLIELYGRDAVYENYYNLESFEKFIGKDFTELYEEWGEWNLEQCHELGGYFLYE